MMTAEDNMAQIQETSMPAELKAPDDPYTGYYEVTMDRAPRSGPLPGLALRALR